MSESNALTRIEPQSVAVGTVEWNLDGFPTTKFNRLVPTQTLGLTTDLLRPLMSTVQLDIETDTYESRDLKQGHRAPNAKGLAKLADAAGVTFTDEVRLDDGSDPDRAYVRVYAEMTDATGMRRRAPGSRDYRLSSQPMSDAQRARARGFVHEHAATRARHRALRALLSLAQSYTIADLQKPFAIARIVANLQHPEMREAFKSALVGVTAAAYGPSRQLPAGDVVDVAEVDDEPIDVTPAPRQLPGESLARAQQPAADADPDWFAGSDPQPPATARPALAQLLHDSAESSGLNGEATEPQKKNLQEILKTIGFNEVAAGLRAAFGTDPVVEGGHTKLPITAAQAQAMINAANSDGPERFVARWREMIGAQAA